MDLWRKTDLSGRKVRSEHPCNGKKLRRKFPEGSCIVIDLKLIKRITLLIDYQDQRVGADGKQKER